MSMADGLHCEQCGVFLDGHVPGYPRRCAGCRPTDELPSIDTLDQAISAARDEGFTKVKAAKMLADEVVRLRGFVDSLPKKMADGVEASSAMTVYAVSPWSTVETLYVEDNLLFASTCFPNEESGADACRYPIGRCYSTLAEAEAAKGNPNESQVHHT